MGVLLDALSHAMARMQILVATHSVELLDSKWIEDRHLRIITWEEGRSTIARVAPASREALERRIAGAGELLRSNALDAAPLPLPASPDSTLLFDEAI